MRNRTERVVCWQSGRQEERKVRTMSVAAVGRPSVSPGGRQYTLVRTRRRTIAVYIRAGGRVEVRAPLGATKAGIDDFVDSRSQWIDRHAALSAARFEQASQFAVVPGCSLLWQGQIYPAVLQEGCRARFDGERFLLPSRSHEENKSPRCLVCIERRQRPSCGGGQSFLRKA